MAPIGVVGVQRLKTRCPVIAAWTAISAVSASRISPDHHDVGILAQDRAQRGAERDARPWRCTGIWVMPGSWYSIGSSTVMIFSLRGIAALQGGVQRRGLAAAGRAGDEHHPVRARDEALDAPSIAGAMPSSVEGHGAAAAIEQPQHDDSRRTSSAPSRRGDPARAPRDAPGCARPAAAALGDVQLGEQLDARDDGVMESDSAAPGPDRARRPRGSRTRRPSRVASRWMSLARGVVRVADEEIHVANDGRLVRESRTSVARSSLTESARASSSRALKRVGRSMSCSSSSR